MSISGVTYCQNWSTKLKGPGRPLTESAARRRWDKGDAFTAVIPPLEADGQPTLVTVCWRNNYLETVFLDRFGRQTTAYEFHRVDDEHLFLERVWLHRYPSDDPSLGLNGADRIEWILYHAEDRMTHHITDKTEHFKEKVEYSDIDFTPNWEQLPEFGDWASVARYERKQPPIGGAGGQ
ncbi:hypothetical protein CDO52_21560 [Nocardiopsis gilva YIM 90087]|uniref:Uncharacterized protein n=1 Tax=Nocardiopsis gilva YIM 90087 TaxID=1235441 RepID=A0A223SAG1_9ACTN|nr:hypothetical protein [Nocardiopsis gilva]ASU85036.1 hypothetical protein CDO52_21560 [Nocardiopsis gilva YIM 90087]